VTPPFRVQLSPEARTHIATINLWWAQNRPAAPTLVASEFENAIEQLSEHPNSGRTHQHRGRQGVRKLLLPQTRHHLYYEIDEGNRLVTILAVWHVSRGHGPRL
jgi:plasmid stabilization system protein ParE